MKHAIVAIFCLGAFARTTLAADRRLLRQLVSCDCTEYSKDVCSGYYAGGGSSFLPSDYKTCAPICCEQCDCHKITPQTCNMCLDDGKCSDQLYACAKECCVTVPTSAPKQPHPKPTFAPKPPHPKPTPSPISKPTPSPISHTSSKVAKKSSKRGKGQHKAVPKVEKNTHPKKKPSKKESIESIGINMSSSMDYLHEGKYFYRGQDKYHDPTSKEDDDKDDDDNSKDDDDSKSEASGGSSSQSDNSREGGTSGPDAQISPALEPTASVSAAPVPAPVPAPVVSPTINVTASNQTNATATVRSGVTKYDVLLNKTIITKSQNNSTAAVNSTLTKSSDSKNINMGLIIALTAVSLAAVIAVVMATTRRVSSKVCLVHILFGYLCNNT